MLTRLALIAATLMLGLTVAFAQQGLSTLANVPTGYQVEECKAGGKGKPANCNSAVNKKSKNKQTNDTPPPPAVIYGTSDGGGGGGGGGGGR